VEIAVEENEQSKSLGVQCVLDVVNKKYQI